MKRIYELDREIAQKEQEVSHLKDNVKAMLFEHVPMEPGRFDARLVWKMVRKPAWRQFVVDTLKADVAEEIYRNTSANRICEVKVEEHAVMPLWNQHSDETEE